MDREKQDPLAASRLNPSALASTNSRDPLELQMADTSQTRTDVDTAVAWHATARRAELVRPAVPCLREWFGLSTQEACAAVREADVIRTRSR